MPSVGDSVNFLNGVVNLLDLGWACQFGLETSLIPHGRVSDVAA